LKIRDRELDRERRRKKKQQWTTGQRRRVEKWGQRDGHRGREKGKK